MLYRRGCAVNADTYDALNERLGLDQTLCDETSWERSDPVGDWINYQYRLWCKAHRTYHSYNAMQRISVRQAIAGYAICTSCGNVAAVAMNGSMANHPNESLICTESGTFAQGTIYLTRDQAVLASRAPASAVSDASSTPAPQTHVSTFERRPK